MTNFSANLSASLPDVGTVFAVGLIGLGTTQFRQIYRNTHQTNPNHELSGQNFLIYLVGWGLALGLYAIALSVNPTGIIHPIVLALGAWLMALLSQNQPLINPKTQGQTDENLGVTAAQLKQCLPSSLIHIQQVVVTAEMTYGRGILRLTNLDRAYGMFQNIFSTQFPNQPWFLEALPNNASSNSFSNGSSNGSSDSDTEEGIPVLLQFPHVITPPILKSVLFKSVLPKALPQVLPWFCLGLTLMTICTSYGIGFPSANAWLYCGGIGGILVAREITLRYLCHYHHLSSPPRSFALPCFGGTGWLGQISLLPSVKSPAVLWQLAVLPNLVSSGLALILFLCAGNDLGTASAVPNITPDIITPDVTAVRLSLHQSLDWEQWTTFPSWGIYLCYKLKMQLPTNFAVAADSANSIGNLVRNSPLTLAAISGLLINALQLLPLSHTEGRYLLQTILGTARTRQWLPIIKILFLAFAITAQPWLQLPLIATFTTSSPLLPTTEDLRDLSVGQEISTFLLWVIVLIFVLPLPRSMV
ncbi:MAG: hypothetical protein ACK456_08165 [Pseudanabaenaceae cyanobacterium]